MGRPLLQLQPVSGAVATMGLREVRLRERHVAPQYRQVFVPQELLELQQVTARAQEVDGEGVPERVRGAADAGDACRPAGVGADLVDASVSHRRAALQPAGRDEQWL